DSSGTALGLMDPELFDNLINEVEIQLNPGDTVVGYTDGITEAMNSAKDEWGLDAFVEACGLSASEGANSLLNNVRQRIQRFVGDLPQYDDMTLLALHVTK